MIIKMNMHRLFLTMFVVILLIIPSGCASTKSPPDYSTETFVMYHPAKPVPPKNPTVSIKVITTDTIKDNTAYVGFEYNDWLKFAEWMHSYKTYQDGLKHVIKTYEEQDPLKKSVDTTDGSE